MRELDFWLELRLLYLHTPQGAGMFVRTKPAPCEQILQCSIQSGVSFCYLYAHVQWGHQSEIKSRKIMNIFYIHCCLFVFTTRWYTFDNLKTLPRDIGRYLHSRVRFLNQNLKLHKTYLISFHDRTTFRKWQHIAEITLTRHIRPSPRWRLVLHSQSRRVYPNGTVCRPCNPRWGWRPPRGLYRPSGHAGTGPRTLQIIHMHVQGNILIKPWGIQWMDGRSKINAIDMER